MKKRTLLDRIRDAIRAFRGKPIGSVTFGVDVKRCSECEYKKENVVLRYIPPDPLKNKFTPHVPNIKTIIEDDAMKFFEEDGTE